MTSGSSPIQTSGWAYQPTTATPASTAQLSMPNHFAYRASQATNTTAASPARKKSKSPSSIRCRTGPDQPSIMPAAPASTAAPPGSPPPGAATTNASGTTSTHRNSPTLYAAGWYPPPASVRNSSAGRLPPSNTGVLG